MSQPIIPMIYRGYIIDFAPEYTHSKYQFVHEDYDGDEDKRIGVKDTVAECMLDIDDQVIERQAKEIGSRNWISINDLLPELSISEIISPPGKLNKVLVYSPSTIGITTAYYWGIKNDPMNGWSMMGVTHWMPLPKSPES